MGDLVPGKGRSEFRTWPCTLRHDHGSACLPHFSSVFLRVSSPPSGCLAGTQASWPLGYLQTPAFISLTLLRCSYCSHGVSSQPPSQIQHHHSLGAKQAWGSLLGLAQKGWREAAFHKPIRPLALPMLRPSCREIAILT